MDYYADQLGDRLENENILPRQWHDRHIAGDMPGEQWLMYRVLEDALHCYLARQPLGHDHRPHICHLKVCRLHDEAEDWIRGEGNPILTFVDVCGWLDLEAAAVRERLETGKVEPMTKHSVRSGQRKDRKITQDQG
jgi:hypothetical protein